MLSTRLQNQTEGFSVMRSFAYLLLLSGLIGGALSKSCIECDVKTEPQCADPFKPSKNLQSFLVTCQGDCIKAKGSSADGAEYLVRACWQDKGLWASVNTTGCISMDVEGAKVTACACSEDQCNAGVVTSLNVWISFITCALIPFTAILL